jgi:hypothetical protein
MQLEDSGKYWLYQYLSARFHKILIIPGLQILED